MEREPGSVAEPGSVPEPAEKPLISEAEFLERGHPGEILPGRQLDRMKEKAERYVADQSMPPDGRERVRKVWLQGRYMPAYQRFTPRAVSADDFG